MYTEQDMEPTFGSYGWRIATIALRVTAVVFLLVSVIILLTNVLPLRYPDHTKHVYFYDVLGFNYMVATIVLGACYLIMQIILAIRQMKNENPNLNFLLAFYGDKITTNLLGTGAVAGFLATREKQAWLRDYEIYVENYIDKSYGSATLLLLAFFCSFILSVISSYALPKKVQ